MLTSTKLQSFIKKLTRHDFFRVMPWLLLVLFLIFTHLAWLSSSATEKKAQQDNFDFHVRETIEHIEKRMQVYEQVLHGLKGLYEASDDINRNEFKKYVDALKLEHNYPGIQGVGFSLIVHAADKEQHLSTMRKQGFPEYNISPEGKRDIYTSIIYLEPFSERNQRAFGYDMYSEPTRRAAMDKSRDTDSAAMSAKVRLLQEFSKDIQAGFLMYLPVFRNDLPHDTLSNRQRNIIGWVYSPFRMDDLMLGIQGEHASNLDIKIFDGDTLETDALMYDSTNNEVSAQSNISILKARKTIHIAHHPWTISISERPASILQTGISRPTAIALIGIIFSFMTAWLARLLLLERQHAISIARAKSRELNQSEARFRTLVENANDIVYTLTPDGIFTYVTENCVTILGLTANSVIGQSFINFVHPDDVPSCLDFLARITKSKQTKGQIEYRIKHKDGTWHWLSSSTSKLTDSASGAAELLGIARDITDRKMLENQLEREAHLDYLTGLANRRYFMEQAEHELLRAQRYNNPLSILMLDIDYFKKINDTYGHEAGDIVLQTLSSVCKTILRKVDIMGRVGGEEFAIMLPDTPISKGIEAGERLREALASTKVALNHGANVTFTVSIGVTSLRDKNENIDKLLSQADEALYEAKWSGRNKVCTLH